MPGAVFMFGKDLRLTDNYGLQRALEENEQILPLYVHDEFSPISNRFAMSWLLDSLNQLSMGITRSGSRLMIRSGNTTEILLDICLQFGLERVYVTEPTYALDSQDFLKLRNALSRRSINLVLIPDRILSLIDKGPQIRQFKQFHQAVSRKIKASPIFEINKLNFHGMANDFSWDHQDSTCLYSRVDLGMRWSPGWEGANSKMNLINKGDFVSHYLSDRDSLHESKGIRLSPYLVNGEISFNSIFSKVLGESNDDSEGENPFWRQVCWNLFAQHTYRHNPRLQTHSILPAIDQLPWSSHSEGLERWKQGLTGYPIVDAGMRELAQTGWIHNRVRMITASFLIKHLLVHWSEGADWFFNNLLDADVASNYFNWQYMAGSMREANPYFRIFNPVLQGKKFDTEGKYVKRWIPELQDYPIGLIHEPWKYNDMKMSANRHQKFKEYPDPIVEHVFARTRALAMFRKYLKKGDN